jgi:xylan 1,4-beta-xylosidase
MGAPQSPDAGQYATLEAASAMTPETVRPTTAVGARRTYDLVVPRQGVAMLVIEPR